MYHVLAQNPKWLAFGFTEKHLFTMKIGWTSVLHPNEAHILARLDTMMLYNFFRF
jgi:hypothetical protein